MYIDPGAGSVILQAVLAGVLGIGVFVRMNWTRIKARFSNGKQTQDHERDSGEENKPQDE